MASLPQTTVRNPDLLLHELDGEFVLYDPGRDAIHTLNATAQFIWAHCEHPPDEIARALQSTYQISFETAQADVKRILSELKNQGLIQ